MMLTEQLKSQNKMSPDSFTYEALFSFNREITRMPSHNSQHAYQLMINIMMRILSGPKQKS